MHTDEEVQHSFEDFYEDVHTEFLKFGEIVNFKVCKNGSSHLRGNVYVHYKSLESAVLAYQSINGRYFAGKLLTCEFVSLTRWRVAICGEFMKSRLKTCSRGSACNFLHCFCNPGGDYEWADWDKPAPRYWLKKMAALFGYTSDGYTDELSPGCHSRRSRSRGLDSPHRKIFSDEDIGHKRNNFRRYRSEGKKTYQDYRSVKHRETYHDDVSDESTDGHGLKRKKRREPESMRSDIKSGNVESIDATDASVERRASDRYMEYRSRSSSRRKRLPDSVHDHHKVLNLDQEDSSYAYKHHDTELRHKGERFSERRKEADSSNDDSFGDSHDSDESGHHRHNRKYLRKIENEVEKYRRASDESKHVRVDKREQNNRKERSRLKNKENASEIKCSGNSQDTHGSKKHRCIEKSSRGMKHTSGSADGGGRLSKDEKRRQKNESKSKRLKSRSDFTDTESDLDEHTHQRHSKKHSRNVKNDAESSDTTFDGDNLKNYEKRRHKSRSSHSKEKPEMKRNKVRSDEDERHHGHRRSANNPCLSKDDSVRRDGEASAAEKVETCVAHSSCQDSGEAEADLEKAYRQAALMKLEEIRKNKDSQAAPSKDSIESPKTCVHENNVGSGVILETPGSIKSKTSVASTKRKRI